MTAPALDQLADTLRSFSDALDDYIKASDDPFAPAMQQLRSLDTQIAMEAAIVARLDVEQLQAEVAAAVQNLGGVIDRAKDAVAHIQNVKAAMSIVASVVSAAVAIGTGNPLGAASAILGMAQGIGGAVDAAQG